MSLQRLPPRPCASPSRALSGERFLFKTLAGGRAKAAPHPSACGECSEPPPRRGAGGRAPGLSGPRAGAAGGEPSPGLSIAPPYTHHTHTRAHTQTHTHAHAHTRVHTRTHAHTNTYAHMHAHAHTHICMHTRVHTHTAWPLGTWEGRTPGPQGAEGGGPAWLVSTSPRGPPGGLSPGGDCVVARSVQACEGLTRRTVLHAGVWKPKREVSAGQAPPAPGGPSSLPAPGAQALDGQAPPLRLSPTLCSQGSRAEEAL